MKRGWVEGQSMVVETPDQRKVLVQLIRIRCDACPPAAIQIFGHHIRALYRLLEDVIAQFPDLVGEEPEDFDPEDFDPTVN